MGCVVACCCVVVVVVVVVVLLCCCVVVWLGVQAYFQQMGVLDTVAKDADEYVHPHPTFQFLFWVARGIITGFVCLGPFWPCAGSVARPGGF